MLKRVLKGWKGLAGFLILAAVLVTIGGIVLYNFFQPTRTPAMRGIAVAERLGCFACHGPGGTGGIANPGSETGFVPSWDGGTMMMYVAEEKEIREWILYGKPKRLLEKEKKEREEHAGHEHDHEEELVEMPAFQDVITDAELEDLVAYVKAVAAYDQPEEPKAREGYRLATELGCFGCHGPSGRVGESNPGSFKGVIPPWTGPDFKELVKNDEELRTWILEGGVPRLAGHPVARHYTQQQIIQMPAYREHLKEGDLDALVAYIHWLRRDEDPSAKE